MFGVYTNAATIFCRTSEPSPLQLRRDAQSWRLSANLSSHQAMPIRSVFPPSSPVPFFRSCFHSTIRQARNRLFCEVPSALRHCHFPKARLTSILRKIGKARRRNRLSTQTERLKVQLQIFFTESELFLFWLRTYRIKPRSFRYCRRTQPAPEGP